MAQTIPVAALKLLDFIASFEAPKGYDTIFSNGQRFLPKKLTFMTIDEVLAAQPSWTRRFGSSAAGRYQFMRNTLVGLKNELGLDGSVLFDASVQDRLGYRLLDRRGYSQFVGRSLPLKPFARSLAQEWASLPVLETTQGARRAVERGQSFYESDGLNHALVDPTRFEATLMDVLKTAQGAGVQFKKPESPMLQSFKTGPGPVTLPDAETAKPWYLSKGVIGGLIAVAVPIISLFFPAARLIEPTTAADWVMKAIQIGGPVAGGLLAMIGRVQATKPIAGSAAAKAAQQSAEGLPAGEPSGDNLDMMALPFHQVLAQLPDLLAGLQQIETATGAIAGDLRRGASGATQVPTPFSPSKESVLTHTQAKAPEDLTLGEIKAAMEMIEALGKLVPPVAEALAKSAQVTPVAEFLAKTAGTITMDGPLEGAVSTSAMDVQRGLSN